MAIELGVLIRGGSALLLLGLAVAIIVLSGRHPRPRLLAAYILFFALEVLAANLRWPVGLPFAAALVAGVLAVPVAWRLAERRTRETRLLFLLALAVGLAFGALVLAAALRDGAWAEWGAHGSWTVRAFFAAGTIAFAGLVPLPGLFASFLAARCDDPAALARLRAHALLLGPYFLTWGIVQAGRPGEIGSLLAALLLIGAYATPWLVAGARTGRRGAVATALVWPAAGLGMHLYELLPANAADTFYDAYGVHGILRILGWAYFVHAILRADLLGVPLPAFVRRRGVSATAALALLLIVAQLAQNFVGAQAGLVLGGLAAAGSVLAGRPLQRAAAPPVDAEGSAHPRAAGALEAKRDAYRRALRVALRDRSITPDEDVELAHVAHELGLTAPEAVRLRHEVERELRDRQEGAR